MKNNNFSILRNETLKRQKILELQKKFEQGLISENDLSKEEAKGLLSHSTFKE